MSTKLSFCIPTYNRALFISHALDSIISQATNEIEIVISDNASTDNTKEVVRRYQKISPCINYVRWPSNQGAAWNILKSIELAKGEYCWLMGDDDVIVPGTVERLLEEFQFNYDIFLINRVWCNFHLKPIKQQYWLNFDINDRVFDFKNSNDMKYYLASANSLGALFSFMSSIVVKRSVWCKVPSNKSFNGITYEHVYYMMSIVSAGATLKYIRDHLVLCRGENSLVDLLSPTKRLVLDLDDYEKFANKLVDPAFRADFLKVMTREHPFHNLLKIRAMSTHDEWQMVEAQLIRFGYKPWMLVLINKFSRLKALIIPLIYFKHRLNGGSLGIRVVPKK